MRGAFVALTVGGVLVYSGFKGLSIIETLAGGTGTPLDPRGGTRGRPGGSTPTAAGGDTPQAVIENVVIPMARRREINVTPESVRDANGRHSPLTLTGSQSDHSGPGTERWAADMSNGNKPTPQMDALANDIAEYFGIGWTGSGAKTVNWHRYQVQLIYRSLVGGNHFNHVHLGIHVRRDQKR